MRLEHFSFFMCTFLFIFYGDGFFNYVTVLILQSFINLLASFWTETRIPVFLRPGF